MMDGTFGRCRIEALIARQPADAPLHVGELSSPLIPPPRRVHLPADATDRIGELFQPACVALCGRDKQDNEPMEMIQLATRALKIAQGHADHKPSSGQLQQAQEVVKHSTDPIQGIDRVVREMSVED